MRLQRLEPRLPMAVLDLNPGPASSTPVVHAQFGDWVYLSADTGAGRRLLRTDGETIFDIGDGLRSTVIRGEMIYGIVDATLAVDAVQLPTGERTTYSTEPGAVQVTGTIGWYSNDVPTYHDIDGRSYSDWSKSSLHPMRIDGDSVYASGDDGIYLCNVTCELVITDEVFISDNQGTMLFSRGNDIYTPEGVYVGLRSDRYFTDTTGGWWTTRGDVLSHFVGADVDRWTITGLKYVAYAAPDAAIAAVNVDGLGYDPYLVTGDVTLLGELNSANLVGRLVGDAVFLDQSFLLVGTQLLPMQAQSYPILLTGQRLGFFWNESPESGTELEVHHVLAGDANYDGIFDSGDLVQLFQLGEYEDDLASNSLWSEGDFDGNGDFDSGDLVAAFAFGKYAQ